MRRRRTLLPGALLLFLWAVPVCPQTWPRPYFFESKTAHENVEFVDQYSTSAIVSIWEGTSEEAELLRLSYAGSSVPQVSYQSARGLDVSAKEDTKGDRESHFYLITAAAGDYETLEKYEVMVQAQEGGMGTVYINLVNINDNPPIIQSPADCLVPEAKLVETDCKFHVSDADGGACYAKLTSSDEHFSFELEGSETKNCKEAWFVLKVVKELDFETYRLHSMTIVALDEGQVDEDTWLPGGSQSTSVSFVVDVDDMPDEAPVWRQFVPSISVLEKTEWNEQLSAMDGDFGLNWDIEYSINYEDLEEKYHGYFDIDPSTGLLEGKWMDRDKYQEQIFKFKVVATEIVPEGFPAEDFPDLPLSLEGDIVIIVNDDNDKWPVVAPTSLQLTEDEEQPFTNKDFSVTDMDLGDNGSFNIEIEENEWSFNFMLIPTYGYQESALTITALNASLMDYEDENWRVITLKIVATEVADPSHVTYGELEIKLNDLNDEYPIFRKEQYQVSVEENQPAGYSVIQTIADDADEGDVVTYSISKAYLTIDESTGWITTINNNAFDYERQTEIVLQVTATDLADHSTFVQVTIEVIDLNDEPPTLLMPSTLLAPDEHSAPGTPASDEITATDPDAGAILEFHIDWERSNAFKQGVRILEKELFDRSVRLTETRVTDDENGRVWRTYLEVADNYTFDWEVFDTMRLQIVVTDLDTKLPEYEHNYQRDALLTVDVTDINDNSPEFTEESLSATFSVFENNTVVRLVGTMVATDADGEGNNDITYSIRPVKPDGLTHVDPQLDIDSKSGQIRTRADNIIDAEEFRELVYVYEVTASDGEHAKSHNINIQIYDINDCSPEVREPETLYYETSFREHEPGSHEVYCIDGYDDDVTDVFHLIYYNLQENTVRDDFRMVNNFQKGCLWVIEGENLDREKTPFHTMTVTTRDNYEDGISHDSIQGPSVTINVTLEDINDQYPVFTNRSEPYEVYETRIKANDTVFTVEVTDDDEGINAEIECEPDAVVTLLRPKDREGSIDDLFRVETDEDAKTCTVLANEDLRLHWGEYELLLTVWDKGEYPHPLSTSSTFLLNVINDNIHRPKIIYPEKSVLRLKRDQDFTSNQPLKDYEGEDIADFFAIDEDDPDSGNGRVTMSLEGDQDLFYLVEVGINTYRLKMNRISDSGIYSLKVNAEDRPVGVVPSRADPVTFDVYLIVRDTDPKFDTAEQILSFSENSTGMAENATLHEATNSDEELLPADERRPIRYDLIGGDVHLFNLDQSTRLLTLKSHLDYKVATEHTLQVLAYQHPSPSAGGATLDVTVHVIDINDLPPEFAQETFYGTFSVNSPSGTEVLQLEATDPDTNDKVTFLMLEDTLTTDSESLKEFLDKKPFFVQDSTGKVLLNFTPPSKKLSGHFSFDVLAHDTAGNVEGHTDRASVKIYVVSDAHAVNFDFLNRVSDVEDKRNEMEAVFSSVFGHPCSIDGVMMSEDSSGVETTVVATHFIDEEENEPMLGTEIKNMFNNGQTYQELYSAMQDLSLVVKGFASDGAGQPEAASYLTVVLTVLCAALGVLAAVFLLAFVVRTRSLNQRLKKLTEPKFGSQDSGLNRDSMAVPGTNRHAMEGSNPVWNNTMEEHFDNMSESSGDSELIGIEDSPEFAEKGGGVGNPAFERRQTQGPAAASAARAPPTTYDAATRRASVNPLAAAAADDDDLPFEVDLGAPRRISLNPLALDADVNDADVHLGVGPSHLNFSFENADPSTEL